MQYYREYNFAPDEVIEYLRKSRQDDPNQTVEEVLEKHRAILDEWVKNNLSGPVPESNIYMERVSGETIKDRIEIKKVLKSIESPYIKAVLVVEPQRLSRGDLEDAGRIINAFRYSNTVVITPHRVYDLQDDADRMFFEMELKQGNQFLEYSKKILARGRTVSAQKGAYLANRAPLGYDKVTVDKVKTLKPNDDAPIVRRIFEMYAAGSGKRSICAWLDSIGIKTAKGRSWSPETVSYILKNVTYIGKIRYNQTKVEKTMESGEVVKRRKKQDEYIEVDGLHEGIVPPELFYEVQKRFGTNTHTSSNKELKNPFAGLIRCKNCGCVLVMGKTSYGEYYLACQHRSTCGTGSIALDYVVDAVTESMNAEIKQFKYKVKNDIGNGYEEHIAIVNRLESQIKALDDKELKQWKDRYESDSPMPDHIFRKLNEELNEQRSALRSALKETLSNAPKKIDYKEKITLFTDAVNALNDNAILVSEKNELLKKCIREITYVRKTGRSGAGNGTQKRPFSLEIEYIL